AAAEFALSNDRSRDSIVPGGSARRRHQQRPRKRARRRREDRGAHDEQRQVLERMAADRGKARRPQKPERRERKRPGATLHEDVDDNRRDDRGHADQRERIDPDHVRAPRLATRKLRSAWSGGVSVITNEY